jgi:hypothetical protein
VRALERLAVTAHEQRVVRLTRHELAVLHDGLGVAVRIVELRDQQQPRLDARRILRDRAAEALERLVATAHAREQAAAAEPQVEALARTGVHAQRRVELREHMVDVAALQQLAHVLARLE